MPLAQDSQGNPNTGQGHRITLDDQTGWLTNCSEAWQRIAGLEKDIQYWHSPETLLASLTELGRTLGSHVAWYASLHESDRTSYPFDSDETSPAALRSAFLETIRQYQQACSSRGAPCKLPAGMQAPALQLTAGNGVEDPVCTGKALNSLWLQLQEEAVAVLGSRDRQEYEKLKETVLDMLSMHRQQCAASNIDSGLSDDCWNQAAKHQMRRAHERRRILHLFSATMPGTSAARSLRSGKYEYSITRSILGSMSKARRSCCRLPKPPRAASPNPVPLDMSKRTSTDPAADDAGDAHRPIVRVKLEHNATNGSTTDENVQSLAGTAEAGSDEAGDGTSSEGQEVVSEAYNDTTCDFRLISKDKVVFWVHSFQLQAASLRFREILAPNSDTPQPTSLKMTSEHETSAILGIFLDLIHGKDTTSSMFPYTGEKTDFKDLYGIYRHLSQLLQDYRCPVPFDMLRRLVRDRYLPGASANPHHLFQLSMMLDDPLGVKQAIPLVGTRTWREAENNTEETARLDQNIAKASVLDFTRLSFEELKQIPPQYLAALLRATRKRERPFKNVVYLADDTSAWQAMADEFYRVFTEA